MHPSTEVALHHLDNLRTKLVERYAVHMDLSKPGSGWLNGAAETIRADIADLDAEITAVVADDAKRGESGQQILDAIRMDTPDMFPTTETPVI